MPINILTWNLLSTELASPSYHVLCKPEHLDTENRWKGIKSVFTEAIKRNIIICVQELSDRWLSYLIPFFQNNKYNFVYDSQFLGVGVAFPPDTYKLHETHFVKIGDELKKICKPKQKEELTFVGKSLDYLLSHMKISQQTTDDTWVKSIKKHNRLVGVLLQDYKSGKFFNIYVYHMPCAFREPSLMHIHTAMLLKTVNKLTGKLPFILAGDFNMKPDSSTYNMITKGGDYTAQFEKSLTHNTPNIGVNDNPLKSVYATFSKEPAFTCYSQPKGSDMFLGCIDYIFVSNHTDQFKINSVNQLPTEPPKSTFPNEDVYSDHLPVGCELELLPMGMVIVEKY
jgi:endonuclease/exonuclease/phosphatase family metal-dependent hydrolase